MMNSLYSLLILSGLSIQDLQLPSGFKATVYARIENARQLAVGERGTVFIGSRGAGKVYALVDKNNDGVADKQYLIASELLMPSGVAFYRGDLYVAAINRILRFKNIESNLHKPPKPEILIDTLPTDEHHGWKAIEFNNRGELFIPVGVPCNICQSNDPRHGSILRFNINTQQYSIYARGVRNSVGLAFHPQDNALWFSDNGRDWMGDDLPPDEINRAEKAGLHFGFPYIHGNNIKDPEYGRKVKNEAYTQPEVELGAHVAPLGLDFYTGKLFPKQFHNSLLVAEHGSWNRSEKSGYRVIQLILNGNRVTGVKPFITGWLDKASDTAWGRPVDILNMPDGSLLISDDYADVIYRVTYNPKKDK